MIRRIRAAWYRRGHRPRPGTLLYSPSLALKYLFEDDPLMYLLEMRDRYRDAWKP